MTENLPETYDEPETMTDRTQPENSTIEIFDLNRHRINGDETVVLLSAFGRGYQALAYDVDKAGEILTTEVIGDAEDYASAESMCKYWVQQNPKGILGGGEDDDADGAGGGFLDKIGLGGSA